MVRRFYLFLPAREVIGKRPYQFKAKVSKGGGAECP